MFRKSFSMKSTFCTGQSCSLHFETRRTGMKLIKKLPIYFLLSDFSNQCWQWIWNRKIISFLEAATIHKLSKTSSRSCNVRFILSYGWSLMICFRNTRICVLCHICSMSPKSVDLWLLHSWITQVRYLLETANRVRKNVWLFRENNSSDLAGKNEEYLFDVGWERLNVGRMILNCKNNVLKVNIRKACSYRLYNWKKLS